MFPETWQAFSAQQEQLQSIGAGPATDAFDLVSVCAVHILRAIGQSVGSEMTWVHLATVLAFAYHFCAV